MNENCKKYQSMIEPFLSDSLTGMECKDFICHVRNCNECMDELQINYVIASVLNELEDDNSKKKSSKSLRADDDADYIAGLKNKMDSAMELYSFSIRNYLVPIIFSLATILFILLAVIFTL